MPVMIFYINTRFVLGWNRSWETSCFQNFLSIWLFMYLSLWFHRLNLTSWCLSHWFWSSLFLHSSRHHICWLWNLLPDIESLLMNLQTLACDMTFLLAVNLDWFIDVWLCRLGKVIHVLAYQITFTLFTTWVNM